MQSKEEALFHKLRSNSPEVKIYKGFGYCAYCSKELYDVFNKNNITCKILLGEYLSDSKRALKCKANNIELIKSFQEEQNVYADIKTALLKRNGKLPARTGHAVVVVDNVIYDMTSGQFGLSPIYTLEEFKDIWTTVYVITVKVDESDLDSFKLASVSKKSVVL